MSNKNISTMNTREQGVQTGNPFKSLEGFVCTQMKITGNDKLNDLFMRQADIKRILEMADENKILKKYVDGLEEKLQILERKYNIKEFEESSGDVTSVEMVESAASSPDFRVERVESMQQTESKWNKDGIILDRFFDDKRFEYLPTDYHERQNSPPSISDSGKERTAPLSNQGLYQHLPTDYRESSPVSTPSPPIASTLPLVGTSLPLEAAPFPLGGTSFPLEGTSFPLERTSFPLEGTLFPQKFIHPTPQPQRRKGKRKSRGPPNVEVVESGWVPANFAGLYPRSYGPTVTDFNPYYHPYDNVEMPYNKKTWKPRRKSAFRSVHQLPSPDGFRPVQGSVNFKDPLFQRRLEMEEHFQQAVNHSLEHSGGGQDHIVPKYNNAGLPFDANMKPLVSHNPQPLETTRRSLSPQPGVAPLSPPLTPQPQVTPQGPDDIVVVSHKLPDGLLEMRDSYAEQMIEYNAKLNPNYSIFGV